MFKTITEGLEEYKKELIRYAERCKSSVKHELMYLLENALFKSAKEMRFKEAEKRYNQMTEWQRLKASPYGRSMVVDHRRSMLMRERLDGMVQALGLTSEEEFNIKVEVKIGLGYPAGYFPFDNTERMRLRGRGVKRINKNQ